MTSDRRAAWWIGCGGGATAGLVVHGIFLLVTNGVEPAANPGATGRSSDVDADRGATPSRTGAAAVVDADTVQRLAQEVAALRERLAAVASAANASERTSAAAPTPAFDDAALVAALRKARVLDEEAHLASLTDDELYAEAERLLRADKVDRLASRRLLQSLLSRPPAAISPEVRANALMLLAQVHRDLKDFPAAASALQRVVDDFGLASDPGARAGNAMAMLSAYTKDYPAGIAIAQQVARVGPATEALEARWGIGLLQRMSGDVAAARATLEQAIRDGAGRPELEYVVTMCQRELEAMEH